MWGLPRPSHILIDKLLPGEDNVHVAAARLTREHPELQKIAAQPEIESGTHPSATTGADVYYGRFGASRSASRGH